LRLAMATKSATIMSYVLLRGQVLVFAQRLLREHRSWAELNLPQPQH